MRWIIKSATIVDPNGPLNGKRRDLLIENGIVEEIKSKLADTKNSSIIDASGLYLSLGWLDLGARFCDPGNEIKEDLTSGLDSAASGGFTEVVVFPSTSPPVDQKASIDYLMRSAETHAVKVLPAGCVSKKGKGAQLAEMADMSLAGAVAFTDDSPIDNADLMNKALEYSKAFNGLIFSTPYNSDLAEGGQMHESKISTQLGLKGIPAISENIRLTRDLELLRYTNGRMHIFGLSSARSVELIKKAKKEGLNVTASVAAHQLAYTDEDLTSFDTNLKVQPPLRSKKDQESLIKGLKEGTIDAVHSDHHPQQTEDKKREFEHAKAGISSIQTSLSFMLKSKGKPFDLEQLVEFLAHGPRKVIGRDSISISKGMEANFTLFSPELSSDYNTFNWRSRSKNNPLMNTKSIGFIKGIINGNKVVLNHD